MHRWVFQAAAEMRFDHNVRQSGYAQRLTKIKAKSADALPKLPSESFDAIYVDGDHRAGPVLLDLACCWRLLKPQGIMILDDYLWELDKPLVDRPQLAIDLFPGNGRRPSRDPAPGLPNHYQEALKLA